MLTLRVQLLDFMDSTPYADARVRLEVRVMAGWLTRIFLDDPAHGPGPGTRPPPNSIEVIVYDESRAVVLVAEGATDAQGRVALSVDAARAFAQCAALRQGDKPPDAVQAQLSARADVYGLALATAERFAAFETPDASRDLVMLADPARLIVGDTSATSTTLWFQLHAAPRALDRFVCVLSVRGSGTVAPRRAGLVVRADRAHTAVSTLAGLAPATQHDIELRLVQPDNVERVLARGSVRTLPTDPRRLSIAFASCHLPGTPTSLNRWQALAARGDIDLAFLIGDQIYGDGIEKIFSDTSDWNERYARRYNQLWAYQPVRRVLRSRPMYMTLDDHEVVDDWGTEKVDPVREAAGVRAYRIFQHAHNPVGFGATRLDYSMRRGPAAFYVTDSRTARGKDAKFPVMGKAQFERLRAWSRSAEVRTADLVFVVVPVPPAMLPIAELEKVASALAAPVGGAGGGLLGAVVGAAIGFVVGGPAGAVVGAQVGAGIGAFAGAVGTKVYYEHLEDTIKEPDVRDAWTYDKNLPDLVRLMDVLFDVANDIGADGRPGPQPKGVFVLSGDYHFGAIHLVRSKRKDGGHDHRNNPTLVQITSSPISKPAIDAELLLKAAAIVSRDDEFKLDDKHYLARFVGHLEQRNFGRVVFEQVGSTRRYRIQLYVEGESDALAEMFEIDLDARPVRMRNLLGEVLAAKGRLTLLRIHDVGTGFGPAADRIDGEVVIGLDTEPGRAFGFQLRRDANRPARQRLLALLRDAFANDRPLTIDYLRTGQHNGTLIRASELPSPPLHSAVNALDASTLAVLDD
ncbi:MAG: alkaline phosphatase D family protein [Rubrivivax sp.]|nr:alkaline phosphatase D family protein [Rubrivivax sp.]